MADLDPDTQAAIREMAAEAVKTEIEKEER
jgi:DNA-directed RNA polymerase subunit K/omega